MVEYRLAKARVAGSNPVSCSQRDRKKSHPMDGSFFYVRALPGSNGSNLYAPLRSSQSNVPRTFCDVSCSQRDRKRVIRWMALFSMFKPCRARTVRMSPLRSGRRRRTSPGRSATSRAFSYNNIQCGCPFFVKKSFTSGVYYKKLLEKICTLSKKSLEKVYILSKSRLKKFVISYITPLKK